jgi:Methyltransferase domain
MHPIDRELQLMLEGRFEEAWAISEELQAIGEDRIEDREGIKNPEMWVRHSFNRGWFLLQQGHYQEGCQLLENGRYLNVYGGGYLKTAAPMWNPQEHSAEGKSIILSLEGGIGDEMIHVRFANQLKEKGFKNVYVAASPEMISIFSRVAGVDGVIQRDQAHTVSHDYWLPAFSAGWVLGNTFDTVDKGNYLSVNPTSATVWNELIRTDKIKVGIRWAGNPKFEHQQFRLFPHQFVTTLNRYKELQIYSFQRDHNVVDLPEGITDLQHFLISWEDTLAALSKMDLVITSCTSIAHAAAAIGVPTWVVVPILPYHTWAWDAPNSTVSPFYSTVKLYRQQKPREWQDTFSALYKDLEKHFKLKKTKPPAISTDKKLKLNLGSGFKKLDGFVNVDNQDIANPDVKHDLMQFPWPFEDNSVDHIVAKDILEHVGTTPQDFIDVLKEMYRVSVNGAAWEIQFPHHRSDLAYDDPTHVRRLTQTTFKLFDQKRAKAMMDANQADTPLALLHDIDIEVADVKHEWVPEWIEAAKARKISEQDLYDALNTRSNVATSVIVLCQVYKPGRAKIQ